MIRGTVTGEHCLRLLTVLVAVIVDVDEDDAIDVVPDDDLVFSL